MTKSQTGSKIRPRPWLKMLVIIDSCVQLTAAIVTLPQIRVALGVEMCTHVVCARDVHAGTRLRCTVVHTKAVRGRQIRLKVFADLRMSVKPLAGIVVEDVRIGAESSQGSAGLSSLQAAVYVVSNRLVSSNWN